MGCSGSQEPKITVFSSSNVSPFKISSRQVLEGVSAALTKTRFPMAATLQKKVPAGYSFRMVMEPSVQSFNTEKGSFFGGSPLASPLVTA